MAPPRTSMIVRAAHCGMTTTGIQRRMDTGWRFSRVKTSARTMTIRPGVHRDDHVEDVLAGPPARDVPEAGRSVARCAPGHDQGGEHEHVASRMIDQIG
jgi:hypothetical protein